MRVDNQQRYNECVNFFTAAMQRFKKIDNKDDPNPAKWKSRVVGLLEQIQGAEKASAAAISEYELAKQQRIEMEELCSRAEADCKWSQLQASSAEQRAANLQDEVQKAEAECQGLRAEIEQTRRDSDCLQQQAERFRQKARENNEQASAITEISTQKLRELEAELEEAVKERDQTQQETMNVFSRWRKCEERTPAQAQKRASSRTGLLFVNKTPGSNIL